MNKITKLLILLLPVITGCKETDEEITILASIESVFISEISASSAVVKTRIINDGKSSIKEKGFCWSETDAQPDTTGRKVKQSGAALDMEATLVSLNPNTVYYVRAYAVNGVGIAYSAAAKFTTHAEDNDDILSKFVSPQYADDYSNIAAWSNRNQWNLANVHDPTVEKCGEYYYMYGTDASYGNVHRGGHFPYRRSKDLVNWEFQGMAMTTVPAWVKDSLNNMRERLGLPLIQNPNYGFWAPVVRKAGNKYRMYYSIVIDNYIATGKANTTANFDNSWVERAFIGLMETNDLATNQWEDKGMVVCSASDKGKNWTRSSLNSWDAYFKWNAIDPSFIITPEGEHYLIYGSWHSGIVSLKLNPETGKPSHLGEPWENSALAGFGTRIYTRGSSRWQASEAPEIIYNPETGYYYLFLAYDELSVAYNTRVCRSRNIAGPYTGYNGASVSSGGEVLPVLMHPYKFNNHSGWVGISHCAVFRDEAGNWFYASQGRLPENTNGNAYSNAIMMGHLRKIRWTGDGWPVVMPERYSAVPDVAIQEQGLVGAWETIRLNYSYRNQLTAQNLTLSADRQASGAYSGAWSWDVSAKILTIGSLKLCVERETDWEANPRSHTLIFAGLNAAGESLWGKK
ncbi:MAG: arabinan endo-1,5-alpha-L-arabinosidase [Dysgonamonadaceae bacterium]|jgi:arabinan endo-1,5-alpha-L-arabinosidase|nr:arabinan endo-1,5-alpha-L-arabinosidase [Dysgonamonadaceae bacterium]